MADAAIVQIDQMLDAFHLRVLALVVEPSRTNRRVALCRHPRIAVGVAALQFLETLVARIDLFDAQERPVRRVGIAFFIAHPAASGTSIAENHGLRLQFSNHFPRARVIVIGAAVDFPRLTRSAIPAVAAVGTVEPNLEQFAILREQLVQLRIEIFHVERCAVESLMAVPRREVETKFQPVFLAGCRQFTDDVALSVFVRRVAHAVVGEFCWPKAKSVVVLRREDDALHTRLFTYPCPLFAVEASRVERLQRCVAIAPFAVAEGVLSEMDECVGFQLLPCHLACAWQGCYRRWLSQR